MLSCDSRVAVRKVRKTMSQMGKTALKLLSVSVCLAEWCTRCRSGVTISGEPSKAAENSSCVMPRMSRASGHASLPASASRGANAGSPRSRDNRMFHGHTDWEVCRHTRFAIPLSTGHRTRSKPAVRR